MKDPIAQLNKVFDSRIRIGIMSALILEDNYSFNDLKALLHMTDGNLASHLKTLEESKYINVKKGFIGRKTNTVYSITKTGEKAFRAHLNVLEAIIRSLA